MDDYKEHRDKLLLEEYRIHNDKINKLIALIWYLSTGIFTVEGLAITNIVLQPLDLNGSLAIAIPSISLMILYLIVSNRWNNIINILYCRVQLIEGYLGFDGHLSIKKDQDKTEEFLDEKKKHYVVFTILYNLFYVKVFRKIKHKTKFVRIACSLVFSAALCWAVYLKANTVDNYIGRAIILNDCTKPSENSENSTQVIGVKSSHKTVLFFNRGSLLVENNYHGNNKSIIELMRYLKGVSATSKYIVTIVGYSCIEKVNSTTSRVSNNYELSKARAENVKLFVSEIMLINNNHPNKIEYYCGGFSNQKSFSENKDDQRKVEITFYEISNIKPH